MLKNPLSLGVVVCAFLVGALLAVILLSDGLFAPRSSPPVGGGHGSFAPIVEKAQLAVVSVYAYSAVTSPSTRQIPREGKTGAFLGGSPTMLEWNSSGDAPLGAGVLIRDDGHVITNCHVVAGRDKVVLRTFSGDRFVARVLGRDSETDLALLKAVSASALPYAELGDSEKARVGDVVLSLGNPFGFERAVTMGIISAKGVVVGRNAYDDFIQTDALSGEGSSGGPLLDGTGRVIGINTAVVSNVTGFSFAIPINMAKRVIQDLQTTGTVVRPWIGVIVADALDASTGSPRGARVEDLANQGPAARSGVRKGDVITAFAGKNITSARDLLFQLLASPTNSPVKLALRRGGQEVVCQVVPEVKKDAPTSTKTATGKDKKKVAAGSNKKKGQETDRRGGRPRNKRLMHG